MVIEAKAREIAALLQQSPQLQAYYKAKDALEQDLEARRLMRYYHRAREKLPALLAKGKIPAEYMLQDYEALQQEYQKNEVIQDYLQAQARAGELLQRVTDIISGETGIRAGGCAGCRRQKG